MERQQRTSLLLILGVFAILTAGMVWSSVRFSKTHYQIGKIPNEVLNRILPKEIPLSAMRPPAIRPADPIRFGGATATLSVIEFGDYQCDHCRAMHDIIQHVLPTYNGRVRFVWRDYPIEDTHPDALSAAVFARCAGLLGNYWGAYDALMTHATLGEGAYREIIPALRLDAQQLNGCRDDKAVTDAVRRDAQEAGAEGVRSTPLLFIGTTAVDHALTEDELTHQIDAALGAL